MSVLQLPFSQPQSIWQFQILKKGVSSRDAQGQPGGRSLGQKLISLSTGESPDPQLVPLPWQKPVCSAGRRCWELSPEVPFLKKYYLITAADARKAGSVQVISWLGIASQGDICHLSKDK